VRFCIGDVLLQVAFCEVTFCIGDVLLQVTFCEVTFCRGRYHIYSEELFYILASHYNYGMRAGDM
jgi:hypothetical protein